MQPPAPILYEDNHLLAVNKLPGQIVQGDKTGDVPLSEQFKAFIKERDAKPGNVFLGVAHRLDRPVSGVLLFAKTGKALARLNAMIREREFQKIYWAICRNEPVEPQGHLLQYLYKNEANNKSYICPPERPGAQKAELYYKVIGHSERLFPAGSGASDRPAPSDPGPAFGHGMPDTRGFEIWRQAEQPGRKHFLACPVSSAHPPGQEDRIAD